MSLQYLLWSVTVVTILGSTYGAPIRHVNNVQNEVLLDDRATDPGYRLPKNFMPESYTIRLSNINLEKKTFSGRTTITFWCLEDSDDLKIHISPTLVYESISVSISNTNNSNEIISVKIQSNTLYEITTITATPGFKEGNKYTITFASYTGVMSHRMAGFYISQYTLEGKVKTLGATQMHPVHARKIFPCFDEPEFKAKFTIGVQRPGDDNSDFQKTITNTNIDPDMPSAFRWDNFFATPKMSTYLLAIIVSNFKPIEEVTSVDGNTFGVIGRPGSESQGKDAFDEGQKILSYMGSYMNLGYYSMQNKKLHLAAIPDFAGGAMENWGLIKFKEPYLLSGESSSVRYKQKTSAIIAHEIAHMWFGNYVTCHWWSDAWLNEGFARYFEFKLPDSIQSIDYKMMTQFPAIVLQKALLSDTSIRSTPLTNNAVNSPAEINTHFGTITYDKGASVIRMMEHWLGSNNFEPSMREYMSKNAYGIVKPNNLYAALQSNALQGQNVSDVMSSWVEQSGYPLITVNINYATKTMNISQKRFKNAWETDEEKSIFKVPITFASKTRPDFGATGANYLLTEVSGEIQNIPVNGEEWFVLNKQQIGYYRVNYDAPTWYILRKALMGDDRKNIHQLNRGQIVDDLFNLAREDVISYNITLDVLEFLGKENEYAPWQSAFPGFSFIRQQLNTNRKLLAKFDKHILNLMKTVTETLKFTDEGDLLTKMFRLNTMNFACSLEHPGCVKYARETFNDFIVNGTAIPPNLREFAYCTGLRQGNGTHYDKLWDNFKSENVVSEQNVIMNALGCTNNETKIISLLDEIMKNNSLIRDQDSMTAMNAILDGNLDNAEYVLSYIESDHFNTVRYKFGSYETLFTSLGSRLTGHQISRFHRLILDHTDTLTKSEIAAGMTAYNNLAQQSNYIALAGREIEIWLDEKYQDTGAGSLATSSVILLCIGFLVNLFNHSL